MTCIHGTSTVIPLPVDFKDDEELRVYLGLPNTEEGRRILGATTPEDRKVYAAMRAMEGELKAGRIPVGFIACNRGRRKRR